jgi:ribosomal-protein-alanine N-acetyltransferase
MGIGQKLLFTVLKKAEIDDCIWALLEVRASNESAIKLYEKFGFEKVTIRKNYYGNEDAILMRKKIKEEKNGLV